MEVTIIPIARAAADIMAIAASLLIFPCSVILNRKDVYKRQGQEGTDDREEGSLHILNHAKGAVFHTERSQEPHHHTAEEQDCSRFL